MKTFSIPQRRKTDPLQRALRLLRQVDPASAEAVHEVTTYDAKIRQYEPDLDVLNPASIARLLEDRICRPQPPETAVGLYVVDVDNFKKYNDCYGHIAGDIVLATVAAGLSICLDHNNRDVLGRWGGEEFLVIKWDLDFDLFRKYGERLVDIVRNRKIQLPPDIASRCRGMTYSEGKNFESCTVSVGGAYFPLVSCEEIVQKADARMYVAKNLGKNRFIGEGLEHHLSIK